MALLKDNQEILMSGEELFRRPDLGPCELVNGRVIPLAPTGHGHGEVELDIGSELRGWARSSGRGRVSSGEVGIYIRRDPDTVRAADVVYISNERFALQKDSGYFHIAPELVVEVLSPADRWTDVNEKIEDYFSAGVGRVWVVDSRLRRISVYRSPNDVQRLDADQVLTDEELLPGFRLSLADLFR